MGISRHVVKRHDLPVVVRQLGQHVPDHIFAIFPFHMLVWVGLVDRHMVSGVRRGRGQRFAARDAIAVFEHHFLEPGGKRTELIHLVDVFERIDERVLGSGLCMVKITEYGVGIADRQILIPSYQFPESPAAPVRRFRLIHPSTYPFMKAFL